MFSTQLLPWIVWNAALDRGRRRLDLDRYLLFSRNERRRSTHARSRRAWMLLVAENTTLEAIAIYNFLTVVVLYPCFSTNIDVVLVLVKLVLCCDHGLVPWELDVSGSLMSYCFSSVGVTFHHTREDVR